VLPSTTALPPSHRPPAHAHSQMTHIPCTGFLVPGTASVGMRQPQTVRHVCSVRHICSVYVRYTLGICSLYANGKPSVYLRNISSMCSVYGNGKRFRHFANTERVSSTWRVQLSCKERRPSCASGTPPARAPSRTASRPFAPPRSGPETISMQTRTQHVRLHVALACWPARGRLGHRGHLALDAGRSLGSLCVSCQLVEPSGRQDRLCRSLRA
jgi:hypothetical protein